MPTDTTGLYFLCPFCDKPFPSAREVRKHVTDREDGEHHKVNGFEMERTIITTFNPYERLTMTEKIIEAVNELGEPLTYEDAEKVAEMADVERNKVMRIWKDNDFEFEQIHGRTVLEFDDLSEDQKDVLLYHYFNDDIEAETIKERTSYEYDKSVKRVLKDYRWLLEDEFLPNNIDNYAIKYRLSSASSEVKETEEENLLNILDKCEVNYKVSINLREKSFDAITKLIENGYKDIAHKLYHDETLEYKND